MSPPVLDNTSALALAARLRKESRSQGLRGRLIKARREISGRMVITTSFGIEDQAITHAIFTEALEINVVTFDTGRLFPETTQVWSNTERHYGRRIRSMSPDHEQIEKLIDRDGVNGFRQSLDARLACCACARLSLSHGLLQALLPGSPDCVQTSLPNVHRPATRALIRSIGSSR
jgi:phosphoadenosine phosphosulfate reductase